MGFVLGLVLAPTAARAEVPWLGITYDDSGSALGARVLEVHEGSAASACGLRAGDLVLGIDQVPVNPGSGALGQVIRSRQAGDRVVLDVLRAGALISVTTTLTVKPSDDELLHNRLVGRRAPGWLLQRADDGRWIDDRALRGRVGVLVFFELGCAECVAALDDLGQWARRQPASALTLFAVAGAELPVGRAFLGRTPLLVSLLLDPTRRPGGLGDVIRQFVISPGGMTVVVTDPRGVVRHAALLDAAELSERDALDDVTAAAARAMRRR